jgi:hypothetical protein
MYKAATRTHLTADTLRDDISFIEIPDSPFSELESLLRTLSAAKAHPWAQTHGIIEHIVSLVATTGLDPPCWKYLLSSHFFKYLHREFEEINPPLPGFRCPLSPVAECALSVFETASSTASYRVCVQLSETGVYVSICRIYIARYWFVPAAGAALCTLFGLLNARFARVLDYIDTRLPNDQVGGLCWQAITVYQSHFESEPMEWNETFYQAEVWLYLSFLSMHFSPSRRAPPSGGNDPTLFAVIVLSSLAGLNDVRNLRGVLPFLGALSPSGIAHWVAFLWEAECHQDLVVIGRDVVLDLLEGPWSSAPKEELRVVFEEMGDIFVCREVEFMLRFFGCFIGKGVYCDDDQSRMAFLLNLNDSPDQECDNRCAVLVNELFSSQGPT